METTEGKNDTIPVENGYHDSDSKRAQVYTNEGYIDGYSFEKPKDNEKAPATVSKSDVTVEEEPIKKVGILSVVRTTNFKFNKTTQIDLINYKLFD